MTCFGLEKNLLAKKVGIDRSLLLHSFRRDSREK